MHILLIHQFFLEDHEGGGSRWNEMSRIWVNEGHKVTVLAGTGHYMASNSGKRRGYINVKTNLSGVRMIRCRVSDQYHSGFAGRLWGYVSFIFSSIWGGVFYANEKYDLIIVTSPPLFAGFTACMLSFWKRIPFALEIRDLWPESAIGAGILKNRFLIGLSRSFEKYLYKKAALISVLTPAFRDILIAQNNIHPDKVFYAPNAADFHLSEQAMVHFDRDVFRKKWGMVDRFVIIYVGAHGVANGLMQLVEAADLLKHTHAFFLFIGDGMEKKSLIRESGNLGLDNVRFMDMIPKSQVFQFIAAADIGTSVLKKAEIFKTVYSNKTFDYFCCKKPVLIAIDGISRQLIADAEAGFFVGPECPADFAAQVEFYMRNPEILIVQGENGYQFAKAHFDRNFLAKKYLNRLGLLLKPADSTPEIDILK